MMNELLTTLNQLDTDLLLAINGWRSAWADSFMYAFSGKLVWIPMYAAFLYVVFRNLPLRTAVGCVIAIALTILFADQVSASLIRPEVARLRPTNLQNPLSEFIQTVNGYRSGRYGFPSCHAANTFGLATFVALLFRRAGLSLFFFAWALITCYSRAYLGVHYPGDLLVGALVGSLGAWLCYSLFAKVCDYRPIAAYRHLWLPMVIGGGTAIILLF